MSLLARRAFLRLLLLVVVPGSLQSLLILPGSFGFVRWPFLSVSARTLLLLSRLLLITMLLFGAGLFATAGWFFVLEAVHPFYQS